MSEAKIIKKSLSVQYAPQSISEVAGQPSAIRQLSAFLECPHPHALIFHGPTGVGKSCTAKALAFDLGCTKDFEDLGGISEIPSGKQDGKAVEDLLRQLRLRPMFGSGWKVAIVNEADCMTPQAEAIWLDGLEHLPPKSVIIFTTNDVRRLSRRLVGRCESVEFDGDSPAFVSGMATLVRRIWKAETGERLAKIPKHLGRYELASNTFSIRLALQQIAPLIRSQQPAPAEVRVPFVRDDESVASERLSAIARKAVATRRRNAQEVAHV